MQQSLYLSSNATSYCTLSSKQIAFGLGKLAFPDNPMAQLGMFMSGCSPGGGLSNMWTYLLGGSLDLSILMTFTSNIIAFGKVFHERV